MSIQNYTPSQINAKKMVNTGVDILLLGKPGTGKTALISDICEEQIAKGRKVLVTASTGLAACNLDGGRTIHSALHWNPRKKEYNFDICSEALRQADVLVVDEVSMLGSSIINHLYDCLECVERKPQLILSGDFFQLPPIAPNGYIRQYPFENPKWTSLDLTPCILEEVVRQSDAEFKEMLGKAMVGDTSCIKYFNEQTQKKRIEGAITLCTKNDFADVINAEKLGMLPGLPTLFYAQGKTDKVDFKKTRVEKCLSVKKNMRVMALRNDSARRYQNGSLGTVVDIGQNSIKVMFDNGALVDVQRTFFTAQEIDNPTNEIEVEQFPLRGGYAISIHKSQGQTFEAVNIMAPDCWDPGQLYVALSRARSIKGIHLMQPIVEKSLKVDPKVINYYFGLLRGIAA